MKASPYIFLFISVFLAGIGQSDAQETDRREPRSVLEDVLGRSASALNVPTLALEGPIDPAKYYVGPSDVLMVAVWGPLNFSRAVTVTPEGDLIVPTVGVLDVGGKTLEEVKALVKKAVVSVYPMGHVTTNLIQTRSFVVTVTGNVLNPGQYEATPADRVEKVIVGASRVFLPAATVTVQAMSEKGKQPIQQSVYNDPKRNQVTEIFGDISTRNIKVFRRSDTLHVDIPKYYATRDDRYNPFLLDGDVLFVPRKMLEKNFIGVYGGVNIPGIHEYNDNDRLSDILLIAGGPASHADLRSIRVVRTNDEGDPMEEMLIDLAADSSLADLKLQYGDRVVVGEKPTRTRDFKVNVLGEVKAPGYYPISDGKTFLSKIIADAGGFTEKALLSGAVILRQADKLSTIAGREVEIPRNLRAHNITLTDSVYFFSTLESGRYPVSVDFRRLFEGKSPSDDIPVMDEDIIYVPSNLEGILVQGQVSRPGYLPYIPGATVELYITRAGGYSSYAEQGDIKIIKKSTLDWVDPDETVIESGDQIWVPKKPRREFSYYFGMVRDVVAVLGGIGTLIILAIQVSK